MEQALQWDGPWPGALFAGIVLSQCAVAVYALRFRTTMHIVGIELGLVETLRINTLSLFYQFFVPLSVGADVTKFVKLKARDHSAFVSVGGIVLDHFVGLVTLVALSCGLLIWRQPLSFEIEIGLAALVVVLLMVTAGIFAIRFNRQGLLNFGAVAREVSRRRGLLIGALGLSLMMQALLAAAVFSASLGWGLEVEYLDILFVMATALIFQAVPLNLAGVGLAEVAGTGLYLAVGLPMSAAILLVSLLYAYRLLSAIVGGAWDLLPQPNASAR
jgi:uncharacterized membrane protein YbhN (UPF0104 family)